MKIILNGQPDQLQSGATLAVLLDRLCLEPIRVAVEVNEELVPRRSYAGRVLQDGDRVEIVTFVGGG